MMFRGPLLVILYVFASTLSGNTYGCITVRTIWEKDPRSDTPLFRVVVNGKAGYIDSSGRVAIPAKFSADNANQGYDDFFEGVAATSSFDAKFIDSNGRPVQFGKYRVSGKSHFSEGLIPAEVSEQPKKYGFIDHEAMLAFAAAFDEVDGFAEGLAPVRMGDKWGYVNRSGAPVIPVRFLMALQFSEGVARVIEDGPCSYDNHRCDQRVLGLTDALTSARKYPACRYTFIDKTGRRLGSGRFVEASDFKEGLAAVSDEGIN
jgi:WG repeat protein